VIVAVETIFGTVVPDELAPIEKKMLASGKVDVVDGGLKKETKEKERIQW
jgi:hypothetical protein